MERKFSPPIKNILTLAFGLITCLFVLTGIFSYIGLNSLATLGVTVHEHPLKVSNAGLQASLGVAKMHRDMKDVVLADDPAALEKAIKRVAEEELKVIASLDVVRARVIGSEGLAIEKEARSMLIAWRPIREEVIQLVKSENRQAAIQITTEKGADHEYRLEEQLLKLATYANRKADGFVEQSIQVKERYSLLNNLIVILGTLLSILIAYLAIRQILSSFALRRQAEEQLASLIEEAPIGMMVKSYDGQFLRVNKVLCKMLGYSEEELLNKTDKEITHPDDLILTAEPMDQILEGASDSFETEKRYLHKNGTVVWGLVKFGVIRAKTSGELHVITQIQDISAQREHEEKLRLQSEIINCMTEGVYLLLPDGTIVFSNPKFEEMFGYEQGELIGKHASILNNPSAEDPKETARIILDIVDEKGWWQGEIQNIKKDGTPFWCYASVVVFDHSKYGKAIVTVQTDISERKKAEEEKANLESQLMQARKMEAIGTLSGGIAHDFNNILAAIIGYGEMVNDEIPEYSKAKSDIREVLKAGKRAKELVQHILSFSRKSEQEKIPVLLQQLTNDAIELLRASIPATIEIHQNIDDSCGTVLADPSQLHQVVMNLCTNAAQAMDDNGGNLEVNLCCLELTTGDFMYEPNFIPGPYLKLVVRDDGPGIAQENLDLIFDPYFTTKEVGKGTGMGLAVVHGIVKSLGGIITVASTPGSGAEFSMYLPESGEQPHVEKLKTVPLPTGDERILVVDDEVSVMEVTTRLLERLGYQANGQTDSRTALALFRSDPGAFDLIISDQTMPNLSGDELAKMVKAVSPDVPVIICSGYSAKLDEEKASLAGISAYLMKPVENRTLAETVRKVLDGGGPPG